MTETEHGKSHSQTYREQLTLLVEQHKKLGEDYKNLLDKNENLAAQNAELSTQNEKLEAQYCDQLTQNDSLRGDNKRLTEELGKWSAPKAQLETRIDGLTLIVSVLQRNNRLIWPENETDQDTPEAKKEREKLQQVTSQIGAVSDLSAAMNVFFFIVEFMVGLYTCAVMICFGRLKKFHEKQAGKQQKRLDERYRELKLEYKNKELALEQKITAIAQEHRQEMDRLSQAAREEKQALYIQLTQELSSAQNKLSELEEQRAALEREQKALEIQKAGLENSLRQKESKITNLHTSISHLEEQKGQLEKSLQEKERTIAQLHQQINQLKQNAEKQTTQIKKLEAEMREKEQTIADLNSQTGKLKKQLEAADKTIADQKGRITNLQNDLDAAKRLSGWLAFACIILIVGFLIFAVNL